MDKSKQGKMKKPPISTTDNYLINELLDAANAAIEKKKIKYINRPKKKK